MVGFGGQLGFYCIDCDADRCLTFDCLALSSELGGKICDRSHSPAQGQGVQLVKQVKATGRCGLLLGGQRVR